jgi:hypothetical protein
MSAQEFGEWAVMYKNEQLHPAADRMRHAQLLAHARNGPLQKSSKTLWSTADCLAPDPWAPPPEAPAPSAPTAAQLAAQVAHINSLMGG